MKKEQLEKLLKIGYNSTLVLAVIYMVFYLLVDAKVISANQPISLIVVAVVVASASSLRTFLDKKLQEKEDSE